MEWVNLGISHAELAIVVVDHCIDAPVLSIFECVEYGSSERLADSQHAALTGMDNGPIAGHKLFISFISLTHLSQQILSLRLNDPIDDDSAIRATPGRDIQHAARLLELRTRNNNSAAFSLKCR